MLTRFLSILVIIVGSVFLILRAGIFDLHKTSIAPMTPVVIEYAGDFIDIVTEEIEVFKENIRKEIKEVAEPIVVANPLISIIKRPSSFLSEIGVFTWTNTSRALNGQLPLSRNKLLDSVAQTKLDDMFARQYFAHVSPIGDGVGDLAKDVGYEFLLIGENLALGDFADDETLLEAWMDSPGHRANILNDKYTEIGVAVGKGNFNGRDTWLAVQSFGVPISVCDSADEDLLFDINERTDEMANLKETLDDLQLKIQQTSPKRGGLYANKVSEYNTLVSQYNSLLAGLDIWIADYNAQIDAFNTCVDAV